jgi:hypothetical protein
MHGWAKDVIDAVGVPQVAPERVLSVFHAPSPASQDAGKQSLQRILGARADDRDVETTWQTRQARQSSREMSRPSSAARAVAVGRDARLIGPASRPDRAYTGPCAG